MLPKQAGRWSVKVLLALCYLLSLNAPHISRQPLNSQMCSLPPPPSRSLLPGRRPQTLTGCLLPAPECTGERPSGPGGAWTGGEMLSVVTVSFWCSDGEVWTPWGVKQARSWFAKCPANMGPRATPTVISQCWGWRVPANGFSFPLVTTGPPGFRFQCLSALLQCAHVLA